MKVIIKIILSLAAITMALTLILTTSNISQHQLPMLNPSKPEFFGREPPVYTKKQVSRFLISRNGMNTTCCNNKCVDLWYDKNNCGACKKICEFTDESCKGKCLNLAFDKRHCGVCNNRCKMTPGYCIFGICDYA